MNAAATPSPFALAAEFLADFITSPIPMWTGNDVLISFYGDGALDLALQALQAGNADGALGKLGMAQSLASSPIVGGAQKERHRMALAARVAEALIRSAICELQASVCEKEKFRNAHEAMPEPGAAHPQHPSPKD